MILLFKASVILIVLLAFYKWVLERESFFASNRFYLIACLIFAITLPFISLPSIVENQGFVTRVIDNQLISTNTENKVVIQEDLTSPKKKDNIVEKEVSPKEITANNTFNTTSSESNVSQSKSSSAINWLLLLYLFGVVVLSINLLAQVVSILRKAWVAKDKIIDEGYVIVNLEGEVEPCSFFQYIFINPQLYDYDTYEQILAHEKIHVEKKHTFDLIFSELAVIAFWFNPFVWMLRKEIEKNIEYQTDSLLIASENGIKEKYQLNLVDIASTTRPLAVTTNYNQSLIKQRILKMNEKKSHKFNYWKYTFLLPILFLLILGLNKPVDLLANTPLHSNIPINELESSQDKVFSTQDELTSPSLSDKDIDQASHEDVSTSSKAASSQLVDVETKLETLPVLPSPQQSQVYFTDCKEFEEAVTKGDLKRVKEILKTLDPDCLKIAKEVLKEKRDEEVQDDQEDETASPANTTFSNCEKLEWAVDNFDVAKVRSILLNDDVSCLKDIYGDPTRDEKLVKGLLAYGAKLSIDKDKIIHIGDVGFEIHILEEGDECDDPDFLELSDAIENADRSRIRKLLSQREFDCPLGEDGVKSDFPFIKEMMKYRPELLVVNRKSVTIYGVSVNIDIHAFDFKERHSTDNKYQEAISELDRIMSQDYSDVLEPGCLDLLNAVDIGNAKSVSNFLKNMNTDCFHKVTETHSGPLGSTSVSHTITPLILASAHADLEVMKIIISHGADVNYQGDGSETALMYAVQSRSIEAVKLLVEKGAKLNVQDEKGYTALDYAEIYKQLDIVRYLRSKGAESSGLKRL